MGLCSDALYSRLRADLSKYYPVDVQIPENAPKDASLEMFASHALLRSFYKKFVETKSEFADQRALEKFKLVNETCANWTLRLDSDVDEVMLGELKSSLYNFWYRNGEPLVSHLHDLLDHARTGPGSSIDARGEDFYTKMFSSPLSCTRPLLYTSYRDYVSTLPEWSAAEVFRAEHFGECHIVGGSRLNFVNKTCDISRLICTEPSLNMFYQLGMAHILENRIREVFNISLDTQPEYNRELSRLGSLRDSFATIDLSSASDSLGNRMLKEILPSDMLRWLNLLRCPGTSVGNEKIELNMVSTMGNGYTFPLQTLLFSCVVSAVYRVLDVKLVRNKSKRGVDVPGNFGVFGDDIIVEQKVANGVIRLLNILGFQVNTEKTFIEGPFRESCGRDFYYGHDVRGIYVKSLTSQQDRYTAINGLNEWSAKTGVFLPLTVGYLYNHLSKRFHVPLAENADAGVRTPLYLSKAQRNKSTGLYTYKRYVSKPRELKVEDGAIATPKWTKKRVYNPSGLLLALLHGSVRNSKIGVRLNVTIYDTKWSLTPYWDYTPTATGPYRPVCNKCPLDMAIHINLCFA